MEPAQIDWKRLDSRFVEDVFYEHIRAPKWFDFLDPNHLDTIDDDAWFCKPECNHPKKAEDYLSTPTSSKYPSLKDSNWTPQVIGQNQRRRVHALSPTTSNNQESENQNPNLLTTPPKSWRTVLKSNSDKKKLNKETAPRLKSTQSARNLFSGKDIIGHISEFCYELKRLATKVTEREDTKKPEVELKNERKPLMEVSKEKFHVSTDNKENNRRKKRVDDAENIPTPITLETVKNRGEERRRTKLRVDNEENIPMTLNLDKVKNKGQEQQRLIQIRTNPPSPQCFSDSRTASLKVSRTKTTEKGTVEQMLKRKVEEANAEEESNKEGRGLDVLWFLRPCTMAN